MKLYVYDHCPFCTRARMVFGLKGMPLELQIVLEDDVDTLTKLVGKKTTPILRKEDGSHMPESMAIVHHIDQHHGTPVALAVPENSPIRLWHETVWRPILELAIPRFGQSDLEEFSTPEAREAFRARQTKSFGKFDTLLGRTDELLETVENQLQALDLILAERDQIDADDFTLYPTLRMLSIVKNVRYPVHVKQYMQRMAKATGVPLHLDQAM